MVRNKTKTNWEKNRAVTKCDKCGTDMTRKESRLWVNNGEVYAMHQNCLPRKVKIERGYIEVKQ
jgi:N-acetylneuraminic acid mutarotase